MTNNRRRLVINKIKHKYLEVSEEGQAIISDHNQAMWDIIRLISPGASGTLDEYLDSWLPKKLIELRIKSEAYDYLMRTNQ